MVHSATLSAVGRFVDTIGVGLDVGIVRPGSAGGRGSAFWRRRPLIPGEVISSLPRFAAENARGAAIYARVHVDDAARNPGVLLLDDLNAGAVTRLDVDGLSPSAVIETSPHNFQAWVRLVRPGETLLNDVARSVLLHLIQTYDADPKAASIVQPGRVPGFTNRKPRHVRPDGRSPFVKLIRTRPMFVAPGAADLIAAALRAIEGAQAGRARGAPEKGRYTPHRQATETAVSVFDIFRREQEQRIHSEVAAGRRPAAASSQSEIDFAAVVAALEAGAEAAAVAAWLSVIRPEKGPAYAGRTVQAAIEFLTERSASLGLR